MGNLAWGGLVLVVPAGFTLAAIDRYFHNARRQWEEWCLTIPDALRIYLMKLTFWSGTRFGGGYSYLGVHSE